MKKYLIIFIFAGVVFLAHFAFSGQAVYGDGIDYWAYLPSLYFDHDIDFRNQFRHLYTPTNNNSYFPELADDILKTKYTSQGMTDNPHPPGVAFVWFPAFFLADIISFIFKLPRTGYADLYQIFAGILSVGVVVFGLRINEKIAFGFTKEKTSNLAVIAVFLATPLLYYGSYDILNSHSASFTVNSLFLYFLFFRKKDNKYPLIIGLLIGLATLIRLQEAFLLLPVGYYLYKQTEKLFLPNLRIILLTFIITISPIFFIWLYLYGRPYPENYFIYSFIFRGFPGSLIHPINGLFSRTPLLFLSLIGLKQFYKHHRNESLFFIIYFFIQFLIIALQGGWLDAAYGGRMYISLLPLFAVCLTYVLKEIRERWSIKYAITLVTLFSFLNMVSIASFVFFEKQVNSGKKRGLEEKTQEKVERFINNFYIK